MDARAELNSVESRLRAAKDRIHTFTIDIELARRNGHPTQLAEETLLHMLVAFRWLEERAERIRLRLRN